eukprot:CAMPEP_0170756718 /NCGR_PEP_ID=MMETSP0437-20130122/14166_1 /TAXON_ID=0 /ORGANISM="Sexangularia sp." /LENGTH=956 /DNA_ID=CAMNT_0011095903 /DNA_START=88 /DNA_END=2958 /DNA_ORIENTATION=+
MNVNGLVPSSEWPPAAGTNLITLTSRDTDRYLSLDAPTISTSTISFCYDNSGLYLGARIVDASVKAVAGPTDDETVASGSSDDHFVIVFHKGSSSESLASDDRVFSVSLGGWRADEEPKGDGFGSGLYPGWQAAVQRVGYGATMEIFWPWSVLAAAGKPSNNDEWRVNIRWKDAHLDKLLFSTTTWAGFSRFTDTSALQDSMDTPSAFGTLRFVDSPSPDRPNPVMVEAPATVSHSAEVVKRMHWSACASSGVARMACPNDGAMWIESVYIGSLDRTASGLLSCGAPLDVSDSDCLAASPPNGILADLREACNGLNGCDVDAATLIDNHAPASCSSGAYVAVTSRCYLTTSKRPTLNLLFSGPHTSTIGANSYVFDSAGLHRCRYAHASNRQPSFDDSSVVQNIGAVKFNGDDVIWCEAPVGRTEVGTHLAGEFTVEVWVRPSGPGTSGQSTIVGLDNMFDLMVTDERRFGMWAGTPDDNDNVYSSKDNYTDNTWYHIAVTFDGQNMRLYRQGEHIRTRSLATVNFLDQSARSAPMTIGSYNNNGAKFFDGRIGQVRLYNEALSDADVLARASSSLYAADLEALTNVVPDCTCAGSPRPRGVCIAGGASAACACEPGYGGPTCGSPTCTDRYDCSGHGTCSAPNTCSCEAGWQGNADCSAETPAAPTSRPTKGPPTAPSADPEQTPAPTPRGFTASPTISPAPTPAPIILVPPPTTMSNGKNKNKNEGLLTQSSNALGTGGVLGVVAGLALCLALTIGACWLRRRRAADARQLSTSDSMHVLDGMSGRAPPAKGRKPTGETTTMYAGTDVSTTGSSPAAAPAYSTSEALSYQAPAGHASVTYGTSPAMPYAAAVANNPNSQYGAAPGTSAYPGYPNNGNAGGFGMGGGGTIGGAQMHAQHVHRGTSSYFSAASNRSSMAAPAGSPANYDAIPELRSGTGGGGGGKPTIQYGTLAGM